MSWLTGYLGNQPSNDSGASSRPRRTNIPPVNYVEVSDEDLESGLNFDSHSPLTSPRRPHQSPSISPRALLQPDPPPVDQVLEEAQQHLQNLPAAAEEPLDEVSEEVEEAGLVVQQAPSDNCQQPPSESEDEEDAMAVNFDEEDKADGEKSADQARSIKIEFDT